MTALYYVRTSLSPYVLQDLVAVARATTAFTNRHSEPTDASEFWARVVYRVLQGNVKKCRELIDFSPCCVLRDRILERVKGDFSSRGDVIVHHVIVYFFYLVLNIT